MAGLWPPQVQGYTAANIWQSHKFEPRSFSLGAHGLRKAGLRLHDSSSPTVPYLGGVLCSERLVPGQERCGPRRQHFQDGRVPPTPARMGEWRQSRQASSGVRMLRFPDRHWGLPLRLWSGPISAPCLEGEEDEPGAWSLKEGIWEPVFCSNFNMPMGLLAPLNASSDGRSGGGPSFRISNKLTDVVGVTPLGAASTRSPGSVLTVGFRHVSVVSGCGLQRS